MKLLIAALLLLPLRFACAAGDWELKVDDRDAGIRVYSRINEQGYPEFRGVTRVRSRLSAFVALFKDLENMPRWAYRLRKAERVTVVSDTDVYAYTINHLPAPLYDRDTVVRTTIVQDADSLKLIFKGSGVPDHVPKNDRYVRMPVVESSWTFTPLGAGMVEVVFQGYGDPGGTLSSAFLRWFVRLSTAEAPYHTLQELQKVIARPEYQSARYSYIREAAE